MEQSVNGASRCAAVMHFAETVRHDSIRNSFPGLVQREKYKDREVGHALVSCGNSAQHRCVSPGVLARLLSIEKLD